MSRPYADTPTLPYPDTLLADRLRGAFFIGRIGRIRPIGLIKDPTFRREDYQPAPVTCQPSYAFRAERGNQAAGPFAFGAGNKASNS